MGWAFSRRFFALIAAYGLASITTLNHLTHVFTRDNYWKYQAVFYLSLLSLSFIAFPVHRLAIRLGRALLAGAMAAYLAGLITLFLSPLFNRWNFHRVFVAWDLGLCFFLSPAVSMAWLAGLYFGLALLLQERLILGKRTQASSHNTDLGLGLHISGK